MRLRKSTGGSCGGRLTKNTPFLGKRIDIEIDFVGKMLRIGEHPEGFRVNAKTGQFSCSRRVLDEIGSERIALALDEDGWWYGSYAEAEGGE
ncbi:hypothetical protein P88_00540 [Erwinia phage phiEt88]|uniref:hypothetical protein n=1 Tax=Erwinia phage phiEt88 TaxID=925984 RepID=UPI0001F1FC86|nr:hypothetical protein ErPhphiEt88_gp54 [Erwinia phage phiEt88]CBX44565.1 hypothetical protein P88_00540 [Erwinia phage phiEt88]